MSPQLKTSFKIDQIVSQSALVEASMTGSQCSIRGLSENPVELSHAFGKKAVFSAEY